MRISFLPMVIIFCVCAISSVIDNDGLSNLLTKASSILVVPKTFLLGAKSEEFLVSPATKTFPLLSIARE